MGAFKEPHGGELKNLYLSAEEAEQEKQAAKEYASWDLTERQLCDIELLLNGAFSPLEGFLGKADYESVLADMRLTSGVLWPMPITLDVSEEFADSIKSGERIALRDLEGVVIATMDVATSGRRTRRSRRRRSSAVPTRLTRQSTTSITSPIRSTSAASCTVSRRRRTTTSSTCATAPRTPRPFPQARLAQGCRVPDAQPDAPGAPGTYVARRVRCRSEPADSPGRRHDQAGRRRSLHARALLRAPARPLPGADDDAVAAAAGHAHGRTARSTVARDHSQELRLHAPDRRSRPRGTGQGFEGRGLLRSLRCPGTCSRSTRKSSISRWCRSA